MYEKNLSNISSPWSISLSPGQMIWEGLNRRWFANIAFCKLFKVSSIIKNMRITTFIIIINTWVTLFISNYEKYEGHHMYHHHDYEDDSIYNHENMRLTIYIVIIVLRVTTFLISHSCHYQFLQTFSLSSSNYMLVNIFYILSWFFGGFRDFLLWIQNHIPFGQYCYFSCLLFNFSIFH